MRPRPVRLDAVRRGAALVFLACASLATQAPAQPPDPRLRSPDVRLQAADPRLQPPDVHLLVQRSPLAGFRYYAAPAVFDQLTPGEPLQLVREPDNPHDANAIRVDWRGRILGYVPRRQNAALAWALDSGERIEARVAERRRHPNPRRRVEFEVFMR